MPVPRRHKVPQRVSVRVRGNLGIAGGSAGENHEQNVFTLGAAFVLDRRVGRAEHAVFLIEAAPALALAVHEDAGRHLRTLLQRQLHLMRAVAGRRAQHGLCARRTEAVDQILLEQLVGGQNRHRANLVERHHRNPELIMPSQHQKHAVALADAQRVEIVGRAVGQARNVGKGEPALGLVPVDVQHRQLVRRGLCHFVHDVEGEIEMLRILESNRLERAVRVLLGVNPALPQMLALVSARRGRGRGLRKRHAGLSCSQLRNRLAAGIEHDGIEQAVAAVHGDHAMRRGGIVVNAVAGAQNFPVRAHLHLQLA